MKRILILVLGLLFAGLLVSCSSDDSATTDDPSAEVLPPVMVDGPESLNLKVGNTINITTEGVTEVSTDNPSVLEVSQPSDDGSAQFNAGAVVLDAGEAKLTVFGESGELYVVDVFADFGP